MKKYVEDFHRNIKLADILLSPLNQGVINYKTQRGFIRRLIQLWPIWYNFAWVAFYLYSIFGERAGLGIVSEQIWCLMTITQMLSKITNGVAQNDKLKQLLKWCENVFTADYQPGYQEIVDEISTKASFLISLCSR